MAIEIKRKWKRVRAKEERRKKVEQERLFPFYKAKSELVRLAVEQAETRACHYDGFCVGAAALVRMSNGTYRIITGANFKKASGPRQQCDHCAEHELLETADEIKCEEIIGMVIAAPHRPDDNTGFNLGATFSCWHCRVRFKKRLARLEIGQPESLRGNTQLIFVNLDDRTKEPDISVDGLLGLCHKKDLVRQPELACDV